MAGPLRAAWFDGRTSGSRAVLLALAPGARGPRLVLHDASSGKAVLALEHRQVQWPERWGSRAPKSLTIDLREHGSVLVQDVPGWEAALAEAGHRPGLAQRMQTRWGTLVVVLTLAAVLLGAFYRWGTPWAATQLTRRVPLAWEQAVATGAMTDFDARWLKPSKLPSERQKELRERFDRLAAAVPADLRRYPGYAPRLRLHFRSGMPANAFALPGGDIILTDEMVQLAAARQLGDDALVGVLAHEVGHVMARHTTRMLVEQAVLNVGLGLALGDVSSLLSTGTSLLTGLAYRRGHETEADCFASALMRHVDLPTAPLADLLLAMEAEHVKKERGGKAREPSKGDAWAHLLSSHPDTHVRAMALKEGAPRGCR
jgi:Zn-dependent protease with chaperone function